MPIYLLPVGPLTPSSPLTFKSLFKMWPAKKKEEKQALATTCLSLRKPGSLSSSVLHPGSFAKERFVTVCNMLPRRITEQMEEGACEELDSGGWKAGFLP